MSGVPGGTETVHSEWLCSDQPWRSSPAPVSCSGPELWLAVEIEATQPARKGGGGRVEGQGEMERDVEGRRRGRGRMEGQGGI